MNTPVASILDVRGPEFLGLYVVLLGAALALAYVVRRVMRGSGHVPSRRLEMDSVRTAYLTGGPDGAVDAAIAGLLHKGVLGFTAGTKSLRVERPYKSANAVRRAVVDMIEAMGRATVPEVRRAVRPVARDVGRVLEEEGLVLAPGRAAAAALAGVVPVLAVLTLGLAKLVVGVSRGRPVGFLFILIAVTGIILWALLKSQPLRTLTGDTYVVGLKARNAALRTSAARSGAALSSDDVAMAMALFGVGVVAHGRLADLKEATRQQQANWASSDSGGSSSSCGSSSCGGGCGGGGCGGCGS